MHLKFGLFIDPLFIAASYPVCEQQALEAERLGFDAVWVSDHLMSGSKPILECFSTLAALATATTTIRLGSLVACNSYRYPSVLAKIAATIDHISNGRLEFGLGAGWNDEEYQAYGIPFPSTRTRLNQLQESLEIILQMWTNETASFQGRYYQINNAVCEPKPLQTPHPPITIGGSGERRTLRLVAKYADRSNWSASVPQSAHLLSVLRQHCDREQRNYDEIEKSWFGRVFLHSDLEVLRKQLLDIHSSGRLYFRPPPRSFARESFTDWFTGLLSQQLVGTPIDCLEKIRAYADLGIRTFIVNFLDFPRLETLQTFHDNIITRI
ncbi:MAG: TIGR03560 family F420-dependent LLM class oxidoreductase [Candidatus Bathyarchaeota archaeon]|nr:TIGR03560 family F420-dependent LLM class oxidoreductase [Candidatus Bathyarchaeota archaeon]